MRNEIVRFLGVIAVVATASLAACGDGSPPGAPGAPGGDEALNPSTTTLDTIVASHGALEPRLTAIDAFAGRRGALALKMVLSTVEGVSIVQVLVVRTGTATLSIDERADGGGVRTYTLTALQLARMVPSIWEGNVEIRKERLEPVDPASVRGQAGQYVLVDPRCLAGPCSEVF